MKSLQAFWHWVDNESPRELDANSFRHLTDVADQALDDAASAVGERIGSPYRGVSALRDYWPAIRELSLSICEALERMHAAVPEGERETTGEFATPYCCTGIGEHSPGCPHCPAPGDKGDVPVAAPMPMPMSYGDGLAPLRDEMPKWYRAAMAAQSARSSIYAREYHGEWVIPKRDLDGFGGGVVKLPAEVDCRPTRFERATLQASPLLAPLQAKAYDSVKGPRYTYGHQTRKLDIYPHIDRAMCDCVRGCEPRSIVLHGDRSQYDETVLPYLTRDVLAPMIADGALVVHQDPSFREFFTNEREWTLP